MRLRRRWTQLQLADRAGLSRLVVTRLESSDGPVDLETLERVGLALGVSVDVGFGRDRLEEVADAGHLAMQELVLRTARAAGWQADFELPTRPMEAWRSIDVGLASHARREAVEVECWNSVGDLGAASRASNRKLAELEALATARWGEDAGVGLLWVVRATARNRALVERYPEVFAARFPGSSREWLRALTSGSRIPREPGLVWCDVGATRLFAWRRPAQRAA